jgi:transcription antitermination factor NusG
VAALSVGSRVKLSTGPLAGEIGVVKRVVRPGRFVVALDFLKQATVEVDAANLERFGVRRPNMRRGDQKSRQPTTPT